METVPFVKPTYRPRGELAADSAPSCNAKVPRGGGGGGEFQRGNEVAVRIGREFSRRFVRALRREGRSLNAFGRARDVRGK